MALILLSRPATKLMHFPTTTQIAGRWLALLVWLGLAAVLQSAPGEGGAYVLAPNDVIEVKVFQEDDLTSKLRVSPQGTINFPLIGQTTVGGLTPQEAGAAIRRALDKDYLVNPQVTVTVIDYGKRRFTVLGQVNKPSTYDMPEREKVTLLDAIAMAGGYTRIADASKVTIRRKSEGRESILRLNAKTMAKDERISTYEVQPGDIITVGESLF